jgi:hypothetical protein
MRELGEGGGGEGRRDGGTEGRRSLSTSSASCEPRGVPRDGPRLARQAGPRYRSAKSSEALKDRSPERVIAMRLLADSDPAKRGGGGRRE